MSNKIIVFTEMLDNGTRLDIRLQDDFECNKYTFNIVFLDEQGEYGGHPDNGQLYETQAACYGDAYIEYITQHVIDSSLK